MNVGLLLAASVSGAIVGACALGVVGVVVDGLGGFPYGGMSYVVAAVVGSMIGALVGPLFAWAGLRDVALWRVITQLSLGAGISGAIGFVSTGFDPLAAVATAVGGSAYATWRLRSRTRPPVRGLPPSH